MSKIKYKITADGMQYPEIETPIPVDQMEIGHYGRLALDNLKRENPQRYKTLLLTGRLETILTEVDEQALQIQDQAETEFLTIHAPADQNHQEMTKLRRQAQEIAHEEILKIVYAPL